MISRRPRVFVSAKLPGGALDVLSGWADVAVGAPRVGVAGPEFQGDAASFDAMITLVSDRVDRHLLSRAPRLRLVANVAVGFDNIDVEACRERGIFVTNTPDVLTEATADFAFALLLAAARRVCEGDRMIRRGDFLGWEPTLLLGKKVHGATLGIVGLGRIGQAMARRARGFAMHVLYAQPRRIDPPLERALGATYTEIDALFAQADFVSLHCPFTADTRHIASRARLASMKPGAVLVNTTRGGCVDEQALAVVLREGPLGGAALDVFEDEPSVTAGLLELDNVVLAPHIASADGSTREQMAHLAVESVTAWSRGADVPRRVV